LPTEVLSNLSLIPFIGALVHKTVSEKSNFQFIEAYLAGQKATCAPEELRLTWDAIRHRHAGFCKQCRKLWPLPRRTVTKAAVRAAIRAIPKAELAEILRQGRLL
jgi:hypothetical protein